MSAVKRFFRYIRALIMGKLDEIENPEIIINEAVREMKENQAKNRERAVQAIALRNQLQNQVDRETKRSAELEANAARALQQGNRDLARTLLREKAQIDQTLVSLQGSLKQAQDASDAVKAAIQREEENIRVKTAEALRLKTDLKAAQIQNDLNKALTGLAFDESGISFDRARDRIEQIQAESNARAELGKTNIDARIQELQSSQIDMEAEEAVKALEAKLGLSPAAAPTSVTAVAGEDDLDRQLAELEQKLKPGG
jgi:phage shock protein A